MTRAGSCSLSLSLPVFLCFFCTIQAIIVIVYYYLEGFAKVSYRRVSSTVWSQAALGLHLQAPSDFYTLAVTRRWRKSSASTVVVQWCSMMFNVCVWGFSGKSKANSLRSAWNNRSTRWILTSLPPHQQHTCVAAAAPFAATNLGANNTLMLSDPLSSWQVLWQARVLARDNECIHELQWTIQRIREQKAS